jgi:hypothetical protein
MSKPVSERDLNFEPVVNLQPRHLSREQIEHYNAQGYIRPLSVFDEKEAGEIRAYFDAMLHDILQRDDGRDAYSINSYQTKCRGLYDIVTDARILDYVEDLLGPNFVCWGAHLFCKMPGDVKSVHWHQDAAYWPFTTARTVTAWLAIDDADEENAAMQFIPGTHRLGQLKFRAATTPSVLANEIVDAEQYGEPVADELKAGEISLHADMLAHGSPPNLSHRRRAGLTIRYCPIEVRGGWNEGSILVRGSDPANFWADNPRPEGEDLSPLPGQLKAIQAG